MLQDRADRLWSRWQEGDPSDAVLRSALQTELAELRGLYRERPHAFDEQVLATLKLLASSLAASQPSPESVLRSVFGFEGFRAGQREIIDALLRGRDCIGVMPTGAGKSLTYQIPARVLGGTTLVISPLIALMKDQVDALSDVGIRATFLNSSLTFQEKQTRVQALANGEYDLVYAAPEGIEASVGPLLARAKLQLIAVDEAHCISHWGHDFRPAYRNLAGLKNRFGRIPVLALTATATPSVTRDIIEQLGMIEPMQFRGSFFRSNLRIEAIRKGAERKKGVRDMIQRIIAAHRGDPGIVYCLSRKSVDSLAEHLRSRGVRALAYHAGMDSDARSTVQDAFRRDDCDVIVATVAFGMGIDKSNVRYVIHRDMPRSIEGYYQEIGRAGRDGVPSDCVLFYSWADVLSYDRFSDDGDATLGEFYRRQARDMFRFASNDDCRHRSLVGHFGERISDCETACDVCAGSSILDRAPVVSAPARTQAAPIRREPETLDAELFEKLKRVRRKLADERGVPAYIVFSDAVLLQLIEKRPRTPEEFLALSGVGPKKLALYGDAFLEALGGA